jgi:hypothetical protein
MGTAIVGWIYTLLQNFANGVVWLLGNVLVDISNYSLVEAQLPWVQQCIQVSTVIATCLFVLLVSYKAVTKYILWNEGTPDSDGGTIWKGVLRTAIYGAAGTFLVYNVFQFGIWYGGALMASPLSTAMTGTQSFMQQLSALPGMLLEDLLIAEVGILILLACLIIVTIQMAIRGAELIFFVVAAPVVALGQMNADGGIWGSWWRSLVVMALSQAVQWLGIKAVVGAMQIVTQPTSNPMLNTALAATSPGALSCLALLLALGAAIATIRGPHLLREWSYRTGVGSGVMSGAMFAGQSAGRAYIMRSMK